MKQQQYEDWSSDASCAFDIVDGQFVVVTADGSDVRAYRPLCALLERARRLFGMEAAFIAHWANGAPIAHRAHDGDDTDLQAGLESLQAMYGRALLDGASDGPVDPEVIRFDAVPVIADGLEYGMLCGRRVLTDAPALEPPALHTFARLISRWFEDAELSMSGLAPLRGESVMGSLSMTMY
jgi:hypothetical protein